MRDGAGGFSLRGELEDQNGALGFTLAGGDDLERIRIVGRAGHIVLDAFELEQKAGVLGVAAAGAQFVEQFGEGVFLRPALARELVVGEEVGEFVGFAGVVLVLDGDLRPAGGAGGGVGAVPFDDVAAAVADDDGPAPALVMDDLLVEPELFGGVGVRVGGVGLEAGEGLESSGAAVGGKGAA